MERGLTKLLHNLRADVTRKQQALADERRAADKDKAAWLVQREAELRQRMALPDDVDPFDADGIKRIIDAKVAEALAAQIAPERQRIQAETRKQELAEFRKQHPDIDTYRARILELVGQGTEARQAYWIARGEASATREAELQAQLEEAKRLSKAEQRKAIGAIGTGSAVGERQPKAKYKNAVEAYRALFGGGE